MSGIGDCAPLVYEIPARRKYNYAGYSRLTAAKYNYAPYPKMNRATRARLLEYFRPHNQRLYELLDRDFEWEK